MRQNHRISFRAGFRSILTLSARALLFVASVNGAKADETATLVITGTVPQMYSIDVEALPKARSLNILEGESHQVVALVRERANVASGYTVRIASANGGSLTHESVPTERLAYDITYDKRASLRPSRSPIAVKTATMLLKPVDHQSPVAITFLGKRSALAGVYSDTLTFEITAP